MKITAVYGTGRKGLSSTYNLAQKAISELKEDDEVKEFFLPKDMDHFCVGCFSCINGHPERCGGYNKIKVIKESINDSDLIIITAPVYVFHAPGQVKTFLDHFAYQWMVHQCNGKMFKKKALIITTAAGAGLRSTVKDVKHSMDFWGVGHVYTYKKAIWAADWTEIDEKRKEKMEESIVKICKRIKKDPTTPRLKMKMFFYACRSMQKRAQFNKVDVDHWKNQGWLEDVRPWK